MLLQGEGYAMAGLQCVKNLPVTGIRKFSFLIVNGLVTALPHNILQSDHTNGTAGRGIAQTRRARLKFLVSRLKNSPRKQTLNSYLVCSDQRLEMCNFAPQID